MQVFSLKIDDFSDDDYTLIAIHTTLEDYHLSFLLNNFLKTNFKRKANGLLVNQKGIESEHSIYEYQNEDCQSDWFLIANVCVVENENICLLSEFETRTILIPEKNKVDYFLKIEGYCKSEFILENINKIPQVITSYLVDIQTLKSKNSLIF